jgi:3-oxoadipate enol-lactonase
MPTVTINSTTLYYTDSGPRDAEPLIFIHGFPFNHEMWDEQAALFESTFRVITYDIRGHGKSESDNTHFLIDFFVDDLFALMDHLKIKSAHVAGLSMGGYIALRGIERSPERFRSLILSNTKSEADSDEAKLKRADSIRTILNDGVQKFAEGFLKAVFASASFDKHPAAVEKIRKIILSTPPSTLCSTLIALAARTDTSASLPTVKIPVLILVGKHDTLTPPAAAQSMANKIPGARMHIFEQAAHMSNLEAAEEFNKYLLDFLSEKK